MKMLKKLALVSAISMISAGAFAMEAMDDESMAQTTGQDGITIKIIPGQFTDAAAIATATAAGYGPGVAVQQLGYASGYKGLSIGEVRIHDDDGFGTRGGATANSGALVIGSGGADSTFVFTNEAKSIQIDLDMVGNIAGPGAGDAPMLNVKITTPTLRIQTGAIYVANSNAAASDDAVDPIDANGTILVAATAKDTDGTAISGKIKILDGMGLTMGNATINVQLGNEAQGAMIKLDTAITGGLIIDDIGLIDAGGTANPAIGQPVTTGGKIYIGQMKIADNGGSDLTVKVNIDVGSVNTTNFTDGNVVAIANDKFTVGGAAILGITDRATLIAFDTNLAADKNKAATVANGGATTHAALLSAAYGADGVAGGVGVNADGTAADIAKLNKANEILTGIATLAGSESVIQQGYNGLVIGLQQVGGANGMDIAMNDLKLGDSSAATMGDVQLLGLNINGTNVVITGH